MAKILVLVNKARSEAISFEKFSRLPAEKLSFSDM